jgi:hypothetical protein
MRLEEKLMARYSYEEMVHAQLETTWKVMVDEAENPVAYLGGAVQSHTILQQADLGFIREVQVQGIVVKERVFFDEGDGIIRHDILEHPLISEGQILLRAACTSVQSPVAPVMLGMHIEWTPGNHNGKAVIDMDLPAVLKREVQALKKKAEELERVLDRRGAPA